MKSRPNSKLFSIQTEIDGKQVRLDIHENSNLTEIAKCICQHYRIDTEFQSQIESTIGQRIQQVMVEEEDSAFRRRVQDLLSANKENNRPASHERSNDADCSMNLYEKCMRTTENRQTMLKTMKMQQEKQEIEKCTFRPSINSKSHRMSRPTVVHEELYKTAKLIDQRKQERRRDQQRKELSQLTFQPEINYCSVRIAEEKKQQAKQLRLTTCSSIDNSKEEKSKHHRSMFTFCPEISPGTRRMVKDKQMPNFTKRLEGYLSKLKAKPVVKQPSSSQSHAHLMNQTLNPMNGKRLSDHRKKPIVSTTHFPVSPGQKKVSEVPHAMPGANKSSELFNRKKTRAFSLLFESLQEDNVVSTQSLQNSNIAADLYCLLLPLIEEIIQLKVNLNYNEFIASLSNFFETLTPGDKDTILNHETKSKWQTEHDQYRNQYKFKPQLCRKSNELSIESRLNALRTNIVREYQTNHEDMSLVMEEEEMGLSSLDSRDR